MNQQIPTSSDSGSHPHQRARMHPLARVLIAVAAMALSLTYFLPLWTISLQAPQYPEGLGFQIWIKEMRGQNPGDIAKINNLNHYIGMKKIVPESMAELKIMPWVMRSLLLFGLAVAVFGRPRLLSLWLIVFILVTTAGFVDYYVWGYDYGHHLDTDHAIIKIPGMSYQPPLIGSKKLLNFTATSLPGAGGWVAIGSFFVGLLLWLHGCRRWRVKLANAAPAAISLALLFGCGQSGPVEIHYGDDQCDYCKMAIADRRFGAELVTTKGKVHRFDSIECLAAFQQSLPAPAPDNSRIWVTDFNAPGSFVRGDNASIIVAEHQESPMGVGLLATSSRESAERTIPIVGGKIVTWDEIRALVCKAWKL